MLKHSKNEREKTQKIKLPHSNVCVPYRNERLLLCRYKGRVTHEKGLLKGAHTNEIAEE